VGEDKLLDQALNQMHQLPIKIIQVNHTLVLQGVDMVMLMPQIMECLKSKNIPILEMKLRENTLEDVFITLTGRRLRE
jgi:hypothetical protein